VSGENHVADPKNRHWIPLPEDYGMNRMKWKNLLDDAMAAARQVCEREEKGEQSRRDQRCIESRCQKIVEVSRRSKANLRDDAAGSGATGFAKN